MARVRPLVESINILAGTKGLPIEAAYSAWADRVVDETEDKAKAETKTKSKKQTEDKAKASK